MNTVLHKVDSTEAQYDAKTLREQLDKISTYKKRKPNTVKYVVNNQQITLRFSDISNNKAIANVKDILITTLRDRPITA